MIASMDGTMPPILKQGEDPAQNDRYISIFFFARIQSLTII